MGRQRIVLCSLVALIAIALSAAVAAVAVVGGLPSERASDLVAAEAAERAAVMGPATEFRPLPAGPATTAIPARPSVTSRVPTPITTSIPSPATTDQTQTIVPPAVTTPPPTAPAVAPPKSCPPAPICFERRPAPEVAPSWTGMENGVTVTARIEPAAPQVGDTVTIFYTAKGPGDYCCWVQIHGPNARPIHDNLVTEGTCPTHAATSGSATVEMTMPADYSFSLWATRGHPCQGPPESQHPAANVHGTFWVNPLP